jgi:hypothetical protein
LGDSDAEIGRKDQQLGMKIYMKLVVIMGLE